jgi:hypothetical protein
MRPASKYPQLYQVNTRVWLTRLTRELGRPATLDDISTVSLERLAGLGFEWLYFLGVWQTGKVGRELSRSNPQWRAEYLRVLPDLTEEDICGSPFAVTGYTAAVEIGGNHGLQGLRERVNGSGMRLMLDFVPNHTAIDHPWASSHPDFFIQGTETDLQEEPRNYILVDTGQGSKIFAHGRDPYFPGWPDTLQLNYANPALQQAMLGELIKAAALCNGLRCDMAMLILPEIFQRTWDLQAEPFWPQAIQAIREKDPDFTFMAEVYWDLEDALLAQDFDYAYDKRLYDLLRDNKVSEIHKHLGVSPTQQIHLARFLENHDEPRAAALFPTNQHQAAAVITYFSPALRFYHTGQLEGYRHKISIHLCRGPDEQGDPVLQQFYQRLLEVLRLDILQSGVWQQLSTKPAWEGNDSYTTFITGAWSGINNRRVLVIVNYAPHQSQGYLQIPFQEFAGEEVILKDLLGSDLYERQGDGLITTGLYLDLPAWGYYVFDLLTK